MHYSRSRSDRFEVQAYQMEQALLLLMKSSCLQTFGFKCLSPTLRLLLVCACPTADSESNLLRLETYGPSGINVPLYFRLATLLQFAWALSLHRLLETKSGHVRMAEWSKAQLHPGRGRDRTNTRRELRRGESHVKIEIPFFLITSTS
jgi:hypothetical protein